MKKHIRFGGVKREDYGYSSGFCLRLYHTYIRMQWQPRDMA